MVVPYTESQLITVEVDAGQGAKTQIIGLPDNAVKESQPRVNAAMKNCGYTHPRKGVVINMAPADIRKEGSSYDLTIAIGVMAAGELIAADLLEDSIIMGELSLDGSILPIKGALPIAIQAQKDGYKRLIVKEEITKKDGMVPINVSSYRNGTYVFKLYIDDKLTQNSNFVVTR